ncbi:F-box/kelch-repeat protein At3g06240-like [Bidens hawaiensis]|uniref:F-box/kelch-repeat protein At3g06240-like n=1 Tax=Bidens hawaiensis TaxID=980011 RepID=UPI00404A7225
MESMLKKARKLYKILKMQTKMKTKTKTKKKSKADRLPLSLIKVELLPRLPSKSVGRFMCVCKQWKSFLSTPAFTKMHLRRVTIKDYKLLMLDHRQPVRFHTLNCKPLNDGSKTSPSSCNFKHTDKYVMLASLDGLVCLASLYLGDLAFWNPLTGAYKRLSASPIDSFRITSNPIGFYKDSSNDYKLLYLISGSQPYARAYIYSNRLDSWREIKFLVADRIWTDATFWNQCLYFNVKNMPTKRQSTILCFDVNTDKFKEIQCPVVPSGAEYYCGSLVVLKGCIHLCVSYKILNMKYSDVWKMYGDGGWVKVAAVSCKQSIRQCASIESIGNWLAIVGLEKNILKK